MSRPAPPCPPIVSPRSCVAFCLCGRPPVWGSFFYIFLCVRIFTCFNSQPRAALPFFALSAIVHAAASWGGPRPRRRRRAPKFFERRAIEPSNLFNWGREQGTARRCRTGLPPSSFPFHLIGLLLFVVVVLLGEDGPRSNFATAPPHFNLKLPTGRFGWNQTGGEGWRRRRWRGAARDAASGGGTAAPRGVPQRRRASTVAVAVPAR